ncbi:probable protein S-acyltransferase 15 isoform X1 [Elaeis guineensis]|uniref:S-acyltransferase n=1 Tax=Elaeis guineensis var. tenera TaxID=51953 RepID=A0A6I9S0F4_ELAGV|nr:probable protein S-acyltransferase 15 isoform X1 [Elaeis guineensis]
MRGRKGRFLSVPVLAVISLIGFVYYTTVFVFIEDWLGLSTSLGFLNYLIYSWVAFMSLLSFFVAVIKDPGGVPTSFAIDSENPPKNQGVTSRYCDKCSTYKPPRSHHCRVCKRCVLKMDHHCVWISNCVGYGNYKPFIIFVLHAAVGSIYSMVIFVSSILQKDHDFSRTSHKLFCVLCGLVMIGLSLTIGTLLGWHIYLLTHNMTTIEYREAVRAMWLARKSGQKYHHRFDLGVYKNLSQILGPNMLKWLCPIALGHLKDGTEFPISND